MMEENGKNKERSHVCVCVRVCYLCRVEKVDAQVKGGLHALLGNIRTHLSSYKNKKKQQWGEMLVARYD